MNKLGVELEKLASSIVREGPLATEDAVGWVYRLATTLELLHSAGRAHGRISAKAVDLLARSCDSAGFFLDAYELPEDPCYQSPERLAGGGPTAPDDVWAVGVLLFFAITGHLPFPGPSAIEVSGSLIGREPPTLSAFGVDDLRLQRMIDRLLAFDPAERLCSLHPLRSVLTEWYDFVEGLPALKLGKPSLALFDEATDEEGQKLTAVLHEHPAILQARIEHARKRTAAAAARASAGEQLGSPGGPPSSAAGGRVPRPDSDGEHASPAVSALASTHPSATDPESARHASAAPRPDEHGALHSERSASSTDTAAEQSPANEAPPAEVAEPSGAPSPAVAAGAAPSPDARPIEPAGRSAGRGTGLRGLAVALLFVLAGGAIAYVWSSRQGGSPGTDAPARLTTGTDRAATADGAAAAPPPAATPLSTTATSAPASTEGSDAAPVADAGGPASPAAQLTACVAGLFPPDAWKPIDPPDLRFVCSEPNSIKGARRLHVVLTAAGRWHPTATRAMHEWALLTWYDKAVFGLARAHCCAHPPPLETKPGSKSCAFDAAVTSLVNAASGTDPKALEAERLRYHNAAACLLRSGLASAYGERSMPASGSFTVFARIAERSRRLAPP